jgi:hypothetical protein
VRDNGIGVDSNAVKVGLAGNWALPSIQEWASEIGSHLDIWGSKGASLEIDLRVSGKVACTPIEKDPHYLGLGNSVDDERNSAENDRSLEPHLSRLLLVVKY